MYKVQNLVQVQLLQMEFNSVCTQVHKTEVFDIIKVIVLFETLREIIVNRDYTKLTNNVSSLHAAK